jgi:DNA-3-methyladenine glycosylase
MTPLDDAFYDQEVSALAQALIGCEILVDGIGGRIFETEAYDAADPASHSFGGPTARNAPMFGPRGRAYVYRIYGVHWCLNVVGGLQPGAAVLIRALQPTSGVEAMAARRGTADPRRLCAGPGRLCQALGVTASHNGLSLSAPPFSLSPPAQRYEVKAGPRIGISKATEQAWRFGVAGSPFLSRPFPAGSRSENLPRAL